MLGRPLTPQEKEAVAGLAKADAPPAANTPFEQWRAANPTASVGDWLKLQQDVKPKPAASTDKTPFEEWRTQNPTAPVSDWLKLQSKYRKTAEGAAAPGNMDANIQAAAAGQVNPPAISTKAGQAWWARAAELGLASQIRTRSFGNVKTLDTVATAQKAYDSELDKFNKWNTDHYIVRNAMPNPYEATLSDKKDKLDAAKGADDANFGGTPVGR